MKKLVLLLCVLSAVGCVKSYEDYYTRSFVLSYGNMRGISVAMTDFGLGYSVDFVGEGEWDIAMSGKKKDFYNQLCEKHNDVSYNRRVRVYFYDQGLNPRCFRDFVNLEVSSSADWDAEHPAGTSLNDLARFSSNTPWPYIQSGYTQKYHEQLNGEYYPVDKLISELTPDDMTLLPRGGFYFRFVTRPAQPGKHTLFVRLTADDGKVFEASCDVDFQ